MKILVIAPFYRWFIKDLIEYQSKQLESIHVLVHYNPLVEISEYLPLGGYFNHARLYTQKRIVEKSGIPPNVKVHIVSAIYIKPDGKNRKIGDNIVKLFGKYISQKDIEFDLIHAHFTWPQGYAGIKLGQKFNVPVIITLHENDFFMNSILQVLHEKVLWTWKKANALIRVNKLDIPNIVSMGIPKEKIFYVPNGYNQMKTKIMPKNTAREKLGIDFDKKILFNLARLHKAKGQKHLIKAMYYIQKKREDVMCYIGGTGQLEHELKKLINTLNLEDNVKLLGYVPDDELMYWMNAADLFVLPSLSEGNPTVMFECLGVGLPFVGTKVGGVPEIITSEDYGLLVEPANPEDLAEKILIALEKKWDEKKIREYAEQFTWDNIGKKVENVYRRIINGQ